MHPHANLSSKPNPSRHLSSTTSPVPVIPATLFQSPPFKLNPMPVMRSQGPNHRRNNHVESRFVASAICHQSLTVVSHRGCNFFSELEIDLTSPVSSPCHTLTLGLYGSKSLRDRVRLKLGSCYDFCRLQFGTITPVNGAPSHANLAQTLAAIA
jgi:hypothetical protein